MKLLLISEKPPQENWAICFGSLQFEPTLVRGGLALERELKQNEFPFALWFWGEKAAGLFDAIYPLLRSRQIPFALVVDVSSSRASELEKKLPPNFQNPILHSPDDFLAFLETKPKKKRSVLGLKLTKKSTKNKGELVFRNLLYQKNGEVPLPKKKKIFPPLAAVSQKEKTTLAQGLHAMNFFSEAKTGKEPSLRRNFFKK